MSSLREELQRIYSERGKLTPQLVIEEARPEDHPLHHRFCWDDAIAGPRYREIQAADLIRSVRVVYRPTPNAEPVSLRAFHSVATPDRSNYLPLEELRGDEFAMALVLRNAEREWQDLRRKYGHLQTFLNAVRRSLDDEEVV